MEFFSAININKLDPPIDYRNKILLVGSCFTQHIGNYLRDSKFEVLQNPNGILFDPYSVTNSLISYIDKREYNASDLVNLNELWHSWDHHSSFSAIEKSDSLNKINASQNAAHHFLKEADWLIITLGSSFVYKLTDKMQTVANCHKAPASNFVKHLCTIEEIITAFDTCIHRLFHFNKKLKILFTISPVRHLRDGLVENNRSKARLIESVHHLINKFDRLFYFPAYELVIDVLRDYRFYDIDFAHPNYQATQFVLDKFSSACLNRETMEFALQMKKVKIAMNHKPFHPQSAAHQKFLKENFEKIVQLQKIYPMIDFSKEYQFFSTK